MENAPASRTTPRPHASFARMPRALRLHAVTLPVPDLAAAEKFYRWVLGMKASAEDVEEGIVSLGWGKEDRVILADAEAKAGAREAIGIRIEAEEPVEFAARLAEAGLIPTRVVAHHDDIDEMGEVWPKAELLPEEDPAWANRYVVGLEAPADTRVDLHVPFPAATVVTRGRQGPFYRRTKEWQGLENPGLLGVTLGATAVAELDAFFESLGIAPMSAEAAESDAPLLVGDHQVRIERRDPPGLYGTAFVVAASRLPDLVRTLERFGAPHKLEKNHLLAVDPAGRILAVNGVRAG